jgi:hypothetical protein
MNRLFLTLLLLLALSCPAGQMINRNAYGKRGTAQPPVTNQVYEIHLDIKSIQ